MSKKWEILKNLIYTFTIAISSLFIGLLISFILYNASPIDPVEVYLAAMGILPSQGQYDAAAHELGFDLPLFFQFFRYLSDMFTGNWGLSVNKARGVPTIALFKPRFPRTIEFGILPMIIGIGLGILFGKLAYKHRGKLGDKVIQFFSILGISIPVFFLGMIFQYFLAYKFGWFHPTGFKTPAYDLPTFRTGFPILDAILEGKWYLAFDAMWHQVLPGIVVIIATFGLIAKQTRSTLENKSPNKSVISNTIITGRVLSFVFMFVLLVETIFNLDGFGVLLIDSIRLAEFFLLRAYVFVLITMFVMITFISNSVFMIYKFLIKEHIKGKSKSKLNSEVNKENERAEASSETTLKTNLLERIKTPICIIGAVLVLFFIFISIFPQLIATESYAEAMSVHQERISWSPPSSEYPLGLTDLGRDVLSRILYGIRESIIFGFGAVCIGLVGGVGPGILAGRFTRWGYKSVMGFMIIFYIFPAFLLVLLLIGIFEYYLPNYWVSITFIGILLIPSFTRVIANAMSGELNIHKIGKAIISHIPLTIVIAILFHAYLGFIGLSYWDPLSIQLGVDVNIARPQLVEAPWASLWPCLTIFGIAVSFLILHLGLKGFGPRARRHKNSDDKEF